MPCYVLYVAELYLRKRMDRGGMLSWIAILLMGSLTAAGDPVAEPGTDGALVVAYRGEAYIEFRSWVLSLSIDLGPYATHLRRLDQEIERYEQEVGRIPAIFNRRTDLGTLFNFTSADGAVKEEMFRPWHDETHRLSLVEVTALRDEVGRLWDLFHQLEQVFLLRRERSERKTTLTGRQKRPKRAILGFIGKIFGPTFGLTTEAETRTLRRQIRILSDRQGLLTSALSDSLSMINATRRALELNQRGVEHLNLAVAKIAAQLQALYKEVRNAMGKELLYSEAITHNFAMLHVATSLVRRVTTELLILRDQLQATMHGQLPFDFLSVPELTKFTKELRQYLHQDYIIPYMEDELLAVVQTLPVAVVSDTDTIHVLLSFPIARRSEKFHLYELISVPVPDPVAPDYTVQYNLETKFLAVNEDHSRYRLMTKDTFDICSNGGITHCDVQGATYVMDAAPTCVTALYLKDQERIDRHCKIERSRRPSFPVAQRIHLGDWLLYLPEDTTLDIRCQQLSEEAWNEEPLRLEGGVHQVTLGMGCQGSTPELILPAYVRNETSRRMENQLDLDRYKSQSVVYFAESQIQALDIPPEIPSEDLNLGFQDDDWEWRLRLLQEKLALLQDHATHAEGTRTYVWLILGALLAVALAAVGAAVAWFGRRWWRRRTQPEDKTDGAEDIPLRDLYREGAELEYVDKPEEEHYLDIYEDQMDVPTQIPKRSVDPIYLGGPGGPPTKKRRYAEGDAERELELERPPLLVTRGGILRGGMDRRPEDGLPRLAPAVPPRAIPNAPPAEIVDGLGPEDIMALQDATPTGSRDPDA